MRARRMICVLLTLVMLMSMLPMSALAAGNMPFTDVKVADWFYDAVEYVYEEGLMSGTGATTFSPNGTTTRGMIVTILHRMEGKPAAPGEHFIDVAEGAYYADAVAWASDRGIVAGYGNNRFGPEDPITRQQLATILLRYADYSGENTNPRATLYEFYDADSVASYAKDAMQWAVAENLIQGSGGYLTPNGYATRAQVATILERFCNVGGGGMLLPGFVFDRDNEDKDEDVYTVTFESNGGSAVEPQEVPKGGCVTVPETPEREGFAFAAWYTDKSFSEQFNFLTKINEDCTVYARWIDIADETDTDGDSLTDPMEEYYGTDKTQRDTDGDGLTDLIEVSASNTNPLAADSDANGVSDADEDIDGDGLTNLAEQTNNCNPYSEDTDMDGLSDYEEINTYNTRPDLADTDADGLNDGDEIALELNPLKQKTDGETLDSERTFMQTLSEVPADLLSNGAEPSLKSTMKGNIDSSTGIVKADDETLMSNKALVGDPVFVHSSEDLSKGNTVLSFNIKKGTRSRAIGVSEESQYIICKYIETESETLFEPLETSCEDGILSANIDGEGTYFVLDTETFLHNLGIDPMSYFDEEPMMLMNVRREVIPHMTKDERKVANQSVGPITESFETKVKLVTAEPAPEAEAEPAVLLSKSVGTRAQADIVFIIDKTGSMWEPIGNVATNVNAFADSLVNDYNINANFSVIEFQDITHDGTDSTILHKNGSNSWWNARSVDGFMNEINKLVPDDGGDWAETPIDGLAMARELVASSSTQKFFILITDAAYKEDNQYGISNMGEMVDLLVRDGINVSVITDDWSDWSDTEDGKVTGYKSLYERTSGLYGYIYDTSFYATLIQIASMIDSDVNDGSWVVLDNYETIKLDEAPTAGSTADTDGDGIKDIDELISSTKRDVSGYISTYLKARGLTLSEYLEKGGERYINVYSFKSNPVKMDTDGDGIKDEKDPKPRYFNVTDRHLALFSKLSYSIKDIKENTDFNKDSLGYATLDELNNWKLVGGVAYMNGKGESIMFAANTYQNLTTKEIVVAFRGSDDTWDWIDHGLSFVPWSAHPQAPDAKNYIEETLNDYSGRNIYITGHSLGGYLAAYAAGIVGDEQAFKKCVIFNALGLDATGIKEVKNCLKRNTSKLTNYRVEGDVVSAIGTHYGTTYAYNINYDIAVEYDLDAVEDIKWWDLIGMLEADKNFILATHDMRNFFTYSVLGERY